MIKYKYLLFLILLIVGLLSIFYACKHKETISLKIMSYNIRHGEGSDAILDLSRSAKIIKSQVPNLCGLQEVDNFCLRSGSIGQTDYLAQKTAMKGIFGKFMDFQEGEYGMASLSDKPLKSAIPLKKSLTNFFMVNRVFLLQNHTLKERKVPLTGS